MEVGVVVSSWSNRRMWRLVALSLVLALVATACTSKASDSSPSTSDDPSPGSASEWVLEIEDGDPLQFQGDTFQNSKVVVSTNGVLVVAEPSGNLN